MTGERTDFLYPFIDGADVDASSLLDDLAASAADKALASQRLRQATLARWGTHLATAAADMAARMTAGGRLFTFGNGGSATDADLLAALFTAPPWGAPLPARSLAADQAVLTALGNDVGFDLVFDRQLQAHARPGDVAVAVSTSGNSENLLRALAGARRLGLCTVGIAGTDGGRMSQSTDLDHCIVVHADSVHRIQETQDAVLFELWRLVQGNLGTDPAPGAR